MEGKKVILNIEIRTLIQFKHSYFAEIRVGTSPQYLNISSRMVTLPSVWARSSTRAPPLTMMIPQVGPIRAATFMPETATTGTHRTQAGRLQEDRSDVRDPCRTIRSLGMLLRPWGSLQRVPIPPSSWPSASTNLIFPLFSLRSFWSTTRWRIFGCLITNTRPWICRI